MLDSASQQPIEFATVMIAAKETGEAIEGTTTQMDGTFSIETSSSDFYVQVSFIGFETKTIEDFQIVNSEVDLKTVELAEEGLTLQEAVVRADRSTTEFRLDKRVFNVGEDLSSTGASALEVLNNVPSVNVSIEGQISLRGSAGVQILIDGKPSVLASDGGNALGTITADMIEKVEVITNPSAKYDAEGTSGIINIVLKKEERQGLNGSVSLNTGMPHNHSLGVSVNRRTEKFNIFSQLGGGYKEYPQESENINRDLTNDVELLSEGLEFRNEAFFNFILGSDYHINKYNVVTLSGYFTFEAEDQPSRTDFRIPDEMGGTAASWYRTETTQAANPKFQYELQYKKDFKDDEEHSLLFSALGNYFGKDQSSEFLDVDVIGSDAGGEQQTRTNFSESRYTFMLGYTKPFTDRLTLETGAQYVINDVQNDFAVSDLINGEFVQNDNFTNIFEYNQKVLGAYATGAFEDQKWGIKLGLRVENTDLSTFLVTTQQANNQNFTDLFPTLHTSYKISDRVSIQAGYSKRIFRPRLWDLNPFFNIRNNFSIRTGNPDLLPEYTNSYEVSSIYILEKTSLNLSVYHRYTTDVVERISTFDDNVSLFQPFNIGTNRSTGVEVNGKYDVSKWLSFNGDFNYNYFNREGSLEGSIFDFSADQWSGKLTAQIKLPAKLELEVTGQYRSREQTIQSLISAYQFADLGMRKKILNGRGVINLSIRDVFASRIRESITEQPDFYLYSWGRRGRFVILGFSYGFGKGEAMEYSGGGRHF